MARYNSVKYNQSPYNLQTNFIIINLAESQPTNDVIFKAFGFGTLGEAQVFGDDLFKLLPRKSFAEFSIMAELLSKDFTEKVFTEIVDMSAWLTINKNDDISNFTGD